LVTSTLRSAAESDSVWDKFLASDYHSIISQSDAEIDNNSLSVLPKKDLYLTKKPILIDDGKKVIYYLSVSGSNLVKVSGLAISSLSIELVYTDVSFLLPLIAKICLGVYVNVNFLANSWFIVLCGIRAFNWIKLMRRNAICYQQGVCLLFGEILRGIGSGLLFQIQGNK